MFGKPLNGIVHLLNKTILIALFGLVGQAQVTFQLNQRPMMVFDTIQQMVSYGNPKNVHNFAVVTLGYTNSLDGYGAAWIAEASMVGTNTTDLIYSGVSGYSWRKVTWNGFGGMGIDANWRAEGTSNSVLPGIDKVYQAVITNSATIGQAGEASLIQLNSTNGTYTVNLSHESDGSVMLKYGSTNMFRVQVGALSGYSGAGTLALFDDGSYKSVSSAAGITNININPTDSYLPYRSNATVFGDSSFFQDPAVSTNVAFDSQLLSYGLGAGTANYERMMIDHQNMAGAVFDSQAGGSGTARDFVFKASGTTRATLSTTGSLTIPRSTTNDWIWLQPGFFANGHGDLQLDVPGGVGGEVLIQPAETTLPFVLDTRNVISGAHTAIRNATTNIVTLDGDGNGVFVGTLKSMTTVNVLTRGHGAACSDLTTPIVVGTSQGIIRLPYKMTLTEVRASVKTAQTSGAILTFDVLENGVSILSNPITIDNGETSSKDAASQPVISDTALADDSVITLDTTQVGDGTAIGLQFWVIGTIAP